MNKSILIVDDEPYFQMLIEHALEDVKVQGVTLLKAGNGQDALMLVETVRPALVFLDVMMPLMNGFAVCNSIKNELRMNDVYVALVSARGQGFDRQYGAQVGADLYISKPFDPERLLETAQKVLKLNASGEEAATD